MTRSRDLPTMARPDAITNRELADEVTLTPIPTHMAAGTSRSDPAPAADWSEPVILLACIGAFILSFATVGGFH